MSLLLTRLTDELAIAVNLAAEHVSAGRRDLAAEGEAYARGLRRAIYLVEHASPREEVVTYAALMESKLQANDHKRGWHHCTPAWLMRRLRIEANELERAFKRYLKRAKAAGVKNHHDGAVPSKLQEARQLVGRESADVGNFAMMIADVMGALDT